MPASSFQPPQVPQSPGSAELAEWQRRGAALLSLRRFPEAEALFARAAEREPGSAVAWAGLGRALAGQDRLEPALAHLDRAVEASPEDPELRLWRGKARLEAGLPDQAEADFRWVLAVDPAHAGAIRLLSTALKEHLWPRERLARTEPRLAADPEDWDALRERGAALLRLRRFPEAIADLQRARRGVAERLLSRPEDPALLAGLGAIHLLLRSDLEAQECLTLALLQRPAVPELLLAQARAYHHLAHYEEAQRHLEDALSLGIEVPFDELDSIGAVSAFGLDELMARDRGALEDAERTLARRPESPVALTYLAMARLAAGQAESALELLEAAAARRAVPAATWNRIGLCHLQMGDAGAAMAAFQEALDHDPNNAHSYLHMAQTLFELDYLAAAGEACQLGMATGRHARALGQLWTKILFAGGRFQEALAIHAEARRALRTQFAIHAAEDQFVVAAVRPAAALGADSTRVCLPMVWENRKPRFFGGQPDTYEEKRLGFPAVQVHSLRGVRILPGHDIVVNARNEILYERLERMQDRRALREDAITPLLGDRHVLLNLGLDRQEEIPAGLHLMNDVCYNYAHWLTEILPRLLAAEVAGIDRRFPAIIQEGLPPQHLEALSMVLDGRPVLQVRRGYNYRVGEIHLPTMYGLYHRRRYRPDEAASPEDGAIHPEVVAFLRARFLPDGSTEGHRRLWVSRGSQQRLGQRRLTNEAEIEALFQRAGFETVHPERLTFREQVGLFREAGMIAGPAGAGLVNLLFAPADARILVLTKLHPQVNYYYYTHLAQMIGQSIGYVCGRPANNFGLLDFETDFHIDPAAAEQALREFLEA